MREQTKKFANIGMKSLADLLSLKTTASRKAISDDSAFVTGTHYLQAPVRLYLLLHFYANSNDGFIYDADLKKLAGDLLIHIKTLQAALRKLEAGGFISVTEDPETGTTDIMIINLLDMYKRRGEGGKGYVTVSSNQLEMLLSTKSTNELRLTLTTFMRSTTAMLHSTTKQSDTSITFKTIRNGLPQYLKPCVLRHFLNEGIFPKLFSLKNELMNRKTIKYQLRPEYDAAVIKAKQNEESRKWITLELNQITSQLDNINAEIQEFNHLSVVKWARLLKDHNINILGHDDLTIGTCSKMVRIFRFTQQNIRDAVRIAQDYDTDIVIRGIQLLYNTYLTFHNGIAEGGLRGKDIGGLLRKAVSEIMASGGLQDLSLPPLSTE